MMIREDKVQVESERVGNISLHFQDVFTFVGIVGNVYKFICAWRCDFKYFGSDECTRAVVCDLVGVL